MTTRKAKEGKFCSLPFGELRGGWKCKVVKWKREKSGSFLPSSGSIHWNMARKIECEKSMNFLSLAFQWWGNFWENFFRFLCKVRRKSLLKRFPFSILSLHDNFQSSKFYEKCQCKRNLYGKSITTWKSCLNITFSLRKGAEERADEFARLIWWFSYPRDKFSLLFNGEDVQDIDGDEQIRGLLFLYYFMDQEAAEKIERKKILKTMFLHLFILRNHTRFGGDFLPFNVSCLRSRLLKFKIDSLCSSMDSSCPFCQRWSDSICWTFNDTKQFPCL